jgi:hypothetical protein
MDDQGLTSTTTRRFWVNSTLGYLRVQPRTVLVKVGRKMQGRPARITWTQFRAALVTVTVETRGGIPIRTIAKGRVTAGQGTAVWDGRTRTGKAVAGGVYRIRVSARNEVGTVALERPVLAHRVKPKKKKST